MESKYDSDAETNDNKLSFHNCLVVSDSPVPYFGPPLSLSYFWPPIFSSPPRLFLPVPYHPALPEDLSPDRAGSDSGYTPEKAKTGERRQPDRRTKHSIRARCRVGRDR